ncbi:MAG TPA: hypothetical protein P5114_09180 [Hyphomicrobiaceae bacterium]|nr:hypothetical protein [Hyphomicrobiaceae bacterium]
MGSLEPSGQRCVRGGHWRMLGALEPSQHVVPRTQVLPFHLPPDFRHWQAASQTGALGTQRPSSRCVPRGHCLPGLPHHVARPACVMVQPFRRSISIRDCGTCS